MSKRYKVSETCWFIMSVNHVVNLFCACCANGCMSFHDKTSSVILFRGRGGGETGNLSDPILLLKFIVEFLYSWCGFINIQFLFFVDWDIPLKSAGEWIYLWNWHVNCYYVYMYVFIMCSLCISSQEEENREEKEVRGWGGSGGGRWQKKSTRRGK